MNYQETIQYLFSRLPMYQREGKSAYKANLNNSLSLCKALGNPENNFPSVHIAGTNGKGTTAHYLASILQEAGFKTGLYTSPHLKDFRERIRINGEMISEADVTKFVAEKKPDFEGLGLSFFEWTVGLAFHHFSNEKVDIAIVETGLGGRLDSTNVITPILSVITNIGMDHTQFLGDSIEAIATEKAGIIKSRVPVLIGELQASVIKIFERKAILMNSPLAYSEQVFPQVIPIETPSSFHTKNARSAIAASLLLVDEGWKIPESAWKNGLNNVVSNTGLRGRWETISEKPKIVLDTGHNVEGLEAVTKQIDRTPHKNLHWVFGVVNDKDPSDVLGTLPPNGKYYFCNADIPRALPSSELLSAAGKEGLTGLAYPSVAKALQAAETAADPDDLILVGGSTFVVAEAL